jgi:BirA family biotin operon repressor/biotin-[acetyl-CoA-carboxylase] ligase
MENVRHVIGKHLYLLDEIDSTNSELLRNYKKYDHGAVLCARKQTKGRGRYAREWKSHLGGLYFSFLLKDQRDIKLTYPMVLLTALGIGNAIHFCSTQGIAIKWPNDVYVHHRKLCGILAESISIDNTSHVVIGVGLNVNNTVANLQDLRHPAVSLKDCRGEELDLIDLLDRILNELDQLYSDFSHGNFKKHLPKLNRLLYAKGQEAQLLSQGNSRNITPIAFTQHASLLCLENGQEVEIFYGEM